MIVEQIAKRRQQHSSINWYLYVLVAIAAVAIVVSRRPDALFNPQFWAEDGKIWYADAYNLGVIRSLFLPQVGYLQTTSRLTASFAQFFPLAVAPLIFNLVAIVIQILPAIFIISSRFSALIPSLSTRLLLAGAYLALPNSYETHANITNAQWRLALLACMVLLAAPSDRLAWRFFDLGVILLSALSGPFSILLIPIAILRWWVNLDRWLFLLLLCLVASAVIQLVNLAERANRAPTSLGATPELFFKILGGQVFVSALLGMRGYSWVISQQLWYPSIAVLVCVVGVLALLYAVVKAPLELRHFIYFSALLFAASLISPLASATTPQWQALWLPEIGVRYWLMPMLAFIATLVWMSQPKIPRYLRIAARVTLAIALIGVVLDWQQPPFTDFKFREYAIKFEQSPLGTKVTIPTNPPGWTMDLIKH